MTARPTLVVLLPIQPSARGNGLAMRCDLLVRACATHHDVLVVVVPVAGRSPIVAPTVDAPSLELAVADADDSHALGSWLTDARWRGRLADLAPLPPTVALAPPRLVADGVMARLAGRPIAGVVAARLGMALPGLALAEQLDVPLVLDVDDDDEALERSLGHGSSAAAWARVAATVLPSSALVVGASPGVAAAVGERHGVVVHVAPNAVEVPSAPLDLRRGDGGELRVLMVGNLTYAPNVAGARWMVEAVRPWLPTGAEIDLVGPAADAVRELGGPGVRVHGTVDDLVPHYAAADVVAVPLQHGSGTRLKVLEAFAVGRPVVSTTVGADGLAVRSGEHLLLADDVDGFASALALAATPQCADGLVRAAHQLVTQTYDAQAVTAAVGRLVRDALRTT